MEIGLTDYFHIVKGTKGSCPSHRKHSKFLKNAGFVSALNSYYLFIMDFCVYVGFLK